VTRTHLILAAIYTLMSLITFIAFALDKRAAINGQRRRPEATLHLLELFGGWPGGLLAMAFVRHKNQKLSYIAVFACIVLVHLAGWWIALR